MIIIYTETAASDLEAIFRYQTQYWPQIRIQFEARLSRMERTLAEYPFVGREVLERPSVRVASFITYPYRLFYRVSENAIEVLHIHHTAQKPWYE